MRRRKFFRYVFLFLFIFGGLFFLSRDYIYPCIKKPLKSLKSNPCDIAINPITDIAVITNKKDDSVSIVDLTTETVLATIPVGRAPTEVAIDRELNITVIGNSCNDTVSIVDLDTYQVISTIPVGNKPEGIAVNPLNHTGLVVNNKDGDMSVIDLKSLSVTHTIPTGKKPKDVSIGPLLNVAAVINKKDKTVSVIDMNTYQETSRISVGKSPKAIDINPETHIAAFVNKKDKSITVLNLLTLESYTIHIHKHPNDIALNTLDNRALVICNRDRRLLLIDLDTQAVIKEYPLHKHPRGVAVNNFTNIAVIINKKTDSLTLIQLPNPIPEITSIVPNNVSRGGNELLMDIEGKRFIASSTVFLGDKPLTTIFKDNKKIQAIIPIEMLSNARIFPVTVNNPQPDGGTSKSVDFTVTNPIPSITALDPAEIVAGTGSIALNIYGTGFFNDSEVFFDGKRKETTYVNNTNIQVELTSDELKIPGEYEILIYNSPPGGGNSNKVVFTIKSPLEITITSPSGGETIDKSKVMIKGTVKSDTNDIGITVNGIVANMIGNEWVANNVPLTIGENTITATAIDFYGNMDKESIIIYANNTTQQVKLSANITSGIAPLTTYFSESTSFVPVPYQMDFEGDGIVDYAGTSFNNISFTYSSEGIFYPTLMVTDNQGNTYSGTIAVMVIDKAEIDNLLRSKWISMTNDLSSGNTENALAHISSYTRESYEEIFNVLSNQLPSIVSTQTELNLISIKDNIAIYELVTLENGKVYSYEVIFLNDTNGIWKIKEF